MKTLLRNILTQLSSYLRSFHNKEPDDFYFQLSEQNRDRLQDSNILPDHWKEENWKSIQQKIQNNKNESVQNEGVFAANLRPYLVFASFAVAMILVAGGWFFREHLLLTNQIGYLGEINGTVQINNRIARTGDPIFPGDTIHSNSSASLYIRLNDRSVIHGVAGASMTFHNSSDRTKLELNHGNITAVMNDLDTIWLVETPQSRFQVVGTIFVISIENPGETYYCLCHGHMKLHPTGEEKPFDLQAKHHHALRFIETEDQKIQVKQGTLLHHDDQSIKELTDRVGLDVPWSSRKK